MKKRFYVFLALLVLTLAVCSVAMALEVDEGGLIDYGQINEITKIGTHTVKNPRWKNGKAPTCTEGAVLVFDCNEETHTTHIHNVVINPLGHDWASKSGDEEWGNVKEAATCEHEGYAVDVCLRCKEENEAVKRTIAKKQHEYNDETYNVYKESTCSENGLGNRKCIYCGAPKKEAEKDMVILPLKDHKWTEWNKVASTCAGWGSATRNCEYCNAGQELDASHLSVKDHVKGKIVTIDIADVIPKPNPNYDETILNNKKFQNQQDYEKALAALKFTYEVKKDWLEDCYTRKVTFVCDKCHGAYHDPFTVTLEKPMTIAHIWRDKAEAFAPAEYNITTAGTWPVKDKKEIENPTFINGGNSLPATCLLPGFELYLCKYDSAKHGHTDQDQYKKVPIDPLGHDWTDWYVVETFNTTDGKILTRYARTCNRCGGVENKNEITDKPAAKNGLIKNDKGQWEYWKDDKFQDKFIGILEFEGGQFFVGNGIVPAYDGLALYNSTWYMLSQGQIQTQYNGLALYEGEWFYLTNGTLDTSRAGLVSYDGSQFAVAAGRKLTEVNGLWMNTDGKWYYLSQGQVQNYSGVAQYDGRFFVLKNGVLDTSYNGTIEYDGKTFEVANGQLAVSPIAE